MTYMSMLPWKLLALAHHDPEQVTLAAQACLQLFDAGASGVGHTQSQRFLSNSWHGGEDDRPLRPFVERLASGETILADDMAPLQQWVSRFACLRVAERRVEGVHAQVNAIYRRAPRAQLSYISTELRMPLLCDAITANPLATWHSQQPCGFRDAGFQGPRMVWRGARVTAC